MAQRLQPRKQLDQCRVSRLVVITSASTFANSFWDDELDEHAELWPTTAAAAAAAADAADTNLARMKLH